MKKQANAVLVFIFILLISSSTFAQSKRSMWVWNQRIKTDSGITRQVNNIINDIDGYRDELFAFCKSPHGEPDDSITVLFFACSEALEGNKDNLRNFLAEASDSGLTIEFLAGDTTWATTNQSAGYAKIQQVIEFNAGASSDKEKFPGIQFDVEPYLLDAWDTDEEAVWESFNAFADSCQKMVDAADTSLYFGMAIPRWFDSDNHFGVNGLKEFQSKIDYIAIMDYVDEARRIVPDAQNELENADKLSKKVWVGVDTKELKTPTATFYEEGVVYMEEELAKATNALVSNFDSFEGIAIHSYKYYKSLVYDPENPTDVENDPQMETGFNLNQNYPNPFNPGTTIQFTIPSQEQTYLVVYDTMGREVVTLVDDYKAQGTYQVNFDASNLSSGIYFYKLTAGSYNQVKKMLLLK